MIKLNKPPFKYLVYSCSIHMIILLCLWWFNPIVENPQHEQGPIEGDIFYLPRTNLVKPPEPLDEPIKTEAEPTVEVKVEIPHIPKPTINLQSEWNVSASDSNSKGETHTVRDIHKTNTGKPKPDDVSKNNYARRSPIHVSELQKIRTTPESVNRETLTLSRSTGTGNEDIQEDTKKVEFDIMNTLSGISPSVNAPNVQYKSRRGDALRATSIGNWGGSSSSGGTKTTGSYIKMMKAIANELIKANTSEMVDLILLIDETASMVDNIRGIRAYFDLIFDAFERNKIDVNYGLVTFTDKTKTFGFTDDFGKFNNWLFKINVDHGGDLSEAGLDALMDAVNTFKFRKNAQRHFIYASDAAFHDADYDGKSRYSLDEVIATLQRNAVRVDVIGLDYLPIKQIALATEGTWRVIPGKGYLEYVPPITQTEKMLSKLGTLSIDGNTHVSDTINVHINNPPRPKQLTLTWKVLNPLGERCYGPFTQKTEIPNDTSTIIRLNPKLDQASFQTIPGTYTVIYKLENDRGHKSILRRSLKYQ